MKKIIILLFCIFVFYVIVSDMMVQSLTIPDDAIRIRVIANSNSSYDQEVKLGVKDSLENVMFDLLKDASSSSEAKKIIKSNLSLVNETVSKKMNGVDYGYNVNFGYNYFPQKEYKGVKYDEGYYESLLVTLGSGEGDNWWCVLFPPLCLIEADEGKDVEYRSLVKELIERYL